MTSDYDSTRILALLDRLSKLERVADAARDWRRETRIKLQHARGSRREIALAKAIDTLDGGNADGG